MNSRLIANGNSPTLQEVFYWLNVETEVEYSWVRDCDEGAGFAATAARIAFAAPVVIADCGAVVDCDGRVDFVRPADHYALD